MFGCKPNSESHVENIVADILSARAAALKSAACRQGCIFLTAWDFDGTILKGDATEGLVENGKTIYPGLQQIAIEAGHARGYRPNEFAKFWADYERMDREQGHTAAYTYLPKVFAGSPAAALSELARRQYSVALRPFYFRSSLKMFGQLQQAGIEPYIISAAPHVFVQEAANTFKVERDQIFGIEVEVQNGLLTDKIVEPVTYAQGKTQRLQRIVESVAAREKKPVSVLAAFGNSYHTDGDFLRWTLQQSLPAGKPQAIMINGGKDAGEFAGLFREVQQEQVGGE